MKPTQYRKFVILAALVLSSACAAARPPVTVPPVVVAPQIGVLTVEVEPKAAIVKVGRHGERTGTWFTEWGTRPDGTIVEEFGAGEELTITARAVGYITSAPMVITAVAGPMKVRIVLAAIPPPPVPAIVGKDGNLYTPDGRRYFARWRSDLIALTKTPEQQIAVLDAIVKNGFDGVRVFAGALTWANQTPEGARVALPAFLDRAAARGLVVEVTGLTDTATGYDAREHIRLLAGILTNRRGAVFELMNEIGHASQDPSITPPVLRAWGSALVAPLGIPWAVGAPSGVDEVCPPDPWVQDDGSIRARPIECTGYGGGEYPAAGGSYNTAHLNRDRGDWNEYRRVRELFEIPALNNEPKGCADPGTGGQRYYDPAYAFTLGALDRAFGIGGVHHSQAGLMAEVPLPGSVQEQCERAYVAAHKAIDEVLPGVVGQYKNVGHPGGPFSAATFVDGGSADGVVRLYAFLNGDKGVAVAVGIKGSAGEQYANGWRFVREVGRRTAADGRAAAVWEIAR